MLGWSSPKSEAITLVFEIGFYGLVFDTQEVWIYYQLREIRRYELLSLLLVSFETMCCIEFPNLFLGSINRKITNHDLPRFLQHNITGDMIDKTYMIIVAGLNKHLVRIIARSKDNPGEVFELIFRVGGFEFWHDERVIHNTSSSSTWVNADNCQGNHRDNQSASGNERYM